MFAKKYSYFLFHAGDNLHRVVLCANQYATDHVNGGGCLILFVFIFLHFAQLSTFSQYSECVHWCCVQNLHILPRARQSHWSSRRRMLIFICLCLWLFAVLVFSVVKVCTVCRVSTLGCVQNLHTLPCARHPVQGNATDHLEGTRLHRACTRAWLANIYIRHAQVANWRVICFWAPSMHRGTSESRQLVTGVLRDKRDLKQPKIFYGNNSFSINC